MSIGPVCAPGKCLLFILLQFSGFVVLHKNFLYTSRILCILPIAKSVNLCYYYDTERKGMRTVIEKNCTYHLSNDRIERATYILTEIGLGKVVKEVRQEHEGKNPTWKQVTDTGVMLIRTYDRSEIITMFLPTIKQLRDCYEGGNAPKWLFHIVAHRNKKYYNRQKKMDR